MQTKAKKLLNMAGLFLWWMGAVFVSQELTDGRHIIDLFIYLICLAPPAIFAGYLLRRKKQERRRT